MDHHIRPGLPRLSVNVVDWTTEMPVSLCVNCRNRAHMHGVWVESRVDPPNLRYPLRPSCHILWEGKVRDCSVEWLRLFPIVAALWHATCSTHSERRDHHYMIHEVIKESNVAFLHISWSQLKSASGLTNDAWKLSNNTMELGYMSMITHITSQPLSNTGPLYGLECFGYDFPTFDDDLFT